MSKLRALVPLSLLSVALLCGALGQMWRSESATPATKVNVAPQEGEAPHFVQTFVLKTNQEYGLTGLRFTESTNKEVFADKGLEGKTTQLEGTYEAYPRLMDFLKMAQEKGIAVATLDVRGSSFKISLVQLSRAQSTK